MNDPSLDQEILDLKGPVALFGAGGFIGANLYRRLLRVRTDVYAITHQTSVPWRLQDLEGAKVIHGDVTDAQGIDQLLKHHRFQTIFYFAAYGGYSKQTDRERIYETNFLGLLHVFQAVATLGVSALVNAGSNSEYGSNCAAPAEDSPLLPNSDYAVSKVAAAYLTQFYASKHGLPAINLRLYNVYGPWEEPDRLIPTLIQAGLSGRYPVFVDPDISRDFIYVDDVVAAAVLSATRGVARIPGQSLNIATGRRTTIGEVAAEAQRLFDIKEPPVWSSMPNRSWDLKDWFGNPQRAREVLSWEAATSFREGLARTVAWFKAQQDAPVSRPASPVDRPPLLSAIIACYKDAQAIPIMHERLTAAFQKLQVEYEIIFVNDGSPDDTNDVVAPICARDDRVIVVEHSRNFGSQSAFLSGMGVAAGDAVILLDGDLQDPPEIIPAFYQRWQEGHQVVYGRRVKREMTPLISLCYRAFYWLLNRMAFVTIPRDAGDFSLIDRVVVTELLKLPETDQFLRGLRAWVGFRQTHVDYVRPARPFGHSTNNWIRNIWWARKGIFSFSFVPLDFLFYGGIALTLVSIIAVVLQIVYRLLHPEMPHGITTVIVLILFFGGVNLLGLSILGEYLGKVLEETKRRPHFIRKSIRAGNHYMANAAAMQVFLESRNPERE